MKNIKMLRPLRSAINVAALQVYAQSGVIKSEYLLGFIHDCLKQTTIPLQDIIVPNGTPIGYISQEKFSANIPQDGWLCFNPNTIPCFYLIPNDVVKDKYKFVSRITNDSRVLNTPNQELSEFRKNKIAEFDAIMQIAKTGLEILAKQENIIFTESLFIARSHIRLREYVNYRGLFVVWLKENTSIDYKTMSIFLNRDHSTLVEAFRSYVYLRTIDPVVKVLWENYSAIMQSLITKQ
jgi:hypothetical protein